jgi:hypothetical protein
MPQDKTTANSPIIDQELLEIFNRAVKQVGEMTPEQIARFNKQHHIPND